MNRNRIYGMLGCALPAFGLGILLSFFLPDGFLVILEALIIILFGVMCIMRKC